MHSAEDTARIATQHVRVGRLQEARKCLEQSLGAYGKRADWLSLLGRICRRQSDFAAAIEYTQQSIAASSDSAIEYARLAEVYHDAGLISQAQQACEKALELNPQLFEAHVNLMAILSTRGEWLLAEEYGLSALRIAPNSAIVYFNLGMVCSKQGAHERAVEHYRQALLLTPEDADTLCQLGNELSVLGDLDSAASHWKRALKSDPTCVSALEGLAGLAMHPDTGVDADELEANWAELESGKLSSEQQARVEFALGRLHDSQGRYDQAFSYFEKANELSRANFQSQGQMQDPDALAGFVDRICEICTESFFQNGNTAEVDSKLPIFVVGMPRSGTTLVEQIVSSHPEIHGAGELRAISQLVSHCQEQLKQPYPNCLASLNSSLARRFSDRYLEQIFSLAPATKRVVDKMPDNYMHLGLIALCFPGARVIHCRRDLRDVGLSCFIQNFRSVTWATSLQEIGAVAKQYTRLMAHWESVLPSRIYEVCYEQLVADPAIEIPKLVDFCGVEWDDACLRFTKNERPVETASRLQVRLNIYSQSVGRWKNYERHLEPLLVALR